MERTPSFCVNCESRGMKLLLRTGRPGLSNADDPAQGRRPEVTQPSVPQSRNTDRLQPT